MFIKRPLIVLCTLLSIGFTAIEAAACACCIDPGYYEISTIRPSTYELGILGEIKFDTTANLYDTVSGWDAIRGLNDLKLDQAAGKSIELTAVETFMGKIWKIKLKSASGREGSLTLPMPLKMVKFKVDQHDNEPGTEPHLYKEFRFKGNVANAGGFLRKSFARPTSYFLVFQGRGNGCDNASDFTHWRLELDGRNAEYAFFGKLIP